MVSTSLAGATLGSFTGGSLADKFGRTRTFILDAVPLALGAFLRCVLNYLVVTCKYTILYETDTETSAVQQLKISAP